MKAMKAMVAMKAMTAMKAMKAKKAMKAMAAMKAMKGKKSAMKAGGAMTASGAYSAVAEKVRLKGKDVKGVFEAMMVVAADQLKKNGSFKIAGAINLKLKKKKATAARKGVIPFTKEPCVFKAKPASQTVRVLPMKKFKTAVN